MIWLYLYLISIALVVSSMLWDMCVNGARGFKWKLGLAGLALAPLTILYVASPYIEKFYEWMDKKLR